MRIRLRIINAVLIVVAASAVSIRAQGIAESRRLSDDSTRESVSTSAQSASSVDSPYRLKKGDNEFGVWGGGAFTATTIFGGLHEDEAEGRGFVIAAFRYGRTLAATKRMALQYTLDMIPLAVATGNIKQITTTTTAAGTVTTFRRGSTYGLGVTPLGLQLDFANSSRLKPFIHINGGLLGFTDPLPLPDSGRLGLIGEAGAGVRIFTSERRAVTLGVRFHHISNGDSSGSNRGLNQFIVYAGFSVFK